MPILTEQQPEVTKRRRSWPKVLAVVLGSTLTLALVLVVAPLAAGAHGLRLGPFWISSGLAPSGTSEPVRWGTVAINGDMHGVMLSVNLGQSSFGWGGFYDPKRRMPSSWLDN
jgi:hypothetical protein